MSATAKVRTPKASETGPHGGRLERLQRLIAAADADSLLVTNPTDVAYLTGFLGGDSYLLVPGPSSGRPVIISDFRYQEELEPIRPLTEIHIRRQGMTPAVLEVLGARNTCRVAFQAEHLPFAEADALSRQLSVGALSPTTGLVGQLRARKDEAEVALIRKAIKIQQDALEAVLPTLEPGLTELEVAARIEAEMKTRGSREPGFQTIVAAKANGSLPHYRPGKEKLARNKPVLVDWGAVYQGYHGDMTRVFSLGTWPGKVKEIYGIVLDAHLAASAALAPGKTTHEIDAIARAHIARAGYGEFFGHGLGHGMGLNGHEDPRLNPMYASTVLQPGNVVTIEPGIYLPGVGGVRIEDDFLVTESGARNLCSMPKDLKWATL
jgi:Xaa-Pro aminopeptidase